MKRTFLALLLVVSLLGSLAGCSAGATTQSVTSPADHPKTDYGIAEMASAPAVPPAEIGKGEVSLEGNDTPPQQSAAAKDKIILTAYLDVQTLEFDRLLEQLNQLITQKNGFVENSQISGSARALDPSSGPSQRNASLVARLPSAEFENFLTQVGTLGNIVNSNSSKENVSLQYADTEARKAALTIEYNRLLEILEKAESLEAVVALEARLSEVRYELDRFSSTLRAFDNQVDFSTVTLNIQEVLKITATNTETLSERISAGFSDTLFQIKTGSEDLLVFVIVNSPILLILALVIVLLTLLGKRYNRRMHAKFGNTAPKPQSNLPASPADPSSDTPAKK